jgi:hypothetical protein
MTTWNDFSKAALPLIVVCLTLFTAPAKAREAYKAWPHSASIYILTTLDGANLPASASEINFPLLIRLDKDSFDFNEAQPKGQDLRFSTPTGEELAYQIEDWNPTAGTASVWVRIPEIKGNTEQEIKLIWGNADAKDQSDGKAVFNNNYLSVWHMTAPVNDEVGTLTSKDVNTTAAPGVIGEARHFAGKQGIFAGDKIPNYPAGGASHSSSAWFHAEKPNATILGWGNEGGGRGSKVRMQFRSPPHIHIDSDFSDVNGEQLLPMSQWIHVVHTYENGHGKIYINGQLDGAANPTLHIKSPARLWIGGWYNNYDFVGDIDEVEISSTARSANWIKLEYENQKPLQTLVGPLVQPGEAFSVSPTQLLINEGQSATLSAKAGGARKIYWIEKRGNSESVVAVDQFNFTFTAPRITGDESLTLQLKAVYAKETKTLDIPVTIKEAIPEPIFTLAAPTKWDGRQTIELVPQITNQSDLRAKSADKLHISWTIGTLAVIKEIAPEKLVLKRAQNSGKLTITATIDNGGEPITQSTEIAVTEPKTDPWLARTPDKDEKPEDNQFYARDDKNEGTLYYNGTLDAPADKVFLRVYADDKLYTEESQKPGANNAYTFAIKLKPGLIQYKAVFGTKTNNQEKILHTATNLICGDAYLINGQSNAEAVAWGKEEYTFTSPWIRSFGSPGSGAREAREKLWANATARAEGGKAQIGYWGMELARRLVDDQKIPICIINGAVGGTRIDQHQRNAADPTDVSTIYGRLLWRVREAHLTHGIRGILWHQGENDQGADGPTGGFGYENYRPFFIDMAAGWKTDFPNVQHYYVFQIWPKSCAMGINGSDNRLREVQRNLTTAFSNLSIMSTLGIDPPGGCHYPPAGYTEIAKLICPLVERDNYGTVFDHAITAPNLKRAYFTTNKKDEITMEFNQPMQWTNTLCKQFYLDGQPNHIASGQASTNTITLKLTAPTSAKTLTYLDSKSWSQSTLLKGQNNIAALTFCEVPLRTQAPNP